MIITILHMGELRPPIPWCGFPGGPSGKEPACRCRTHETQVQSLSGKIPWKKAWHPTPVSLPGESHGQMSWAGYSPRGHKESDMTEVTQHTRSQTLAQRCVWLLIPGPFILWPGSPAPQEQAQCWQQPPLSCPCFSLFSNPILKHNSNANHSVPNCNNQISSNRIGNSHFQSSFSCFCSGFGSE